MTKDKQKIIAEAKDRFKRCSDRESNTRVNFMNDLRFGIGDSINNYQWPSANLTARQSQQKPTVTVNRVRVYCNQVINESLKNKAQIEIRPTGGGASFKSAEIFEGLIRHIENNSNAQLAYESAVRSQVYGGFGYCRVTTDFVDSESFDQEIHITRVADPLSVYLDPDIAEFDGSDAKFGFVFRDMNRKDFEKDYPKYKNEVNSEPLGEGQHSDWNDKDNIRLCEYYRIVTETDVLHHRSDGSTVKESDVKDADSKIAAAKEADPNAEESETLLSRLKRDSVAQRDVENKKVEHYLIAGDEIVETHEWLGKYIPIIRWIGEEFVVDGILDRKGHVRGLVAAQQAYNYHTSAGIEFVSLQSKTPWIAPVAAIEGFEELYNASNKVNLAVLPYNHKSEDGIIIPKPEREASPQFASAYLEGMKVAQNEMEMTSGQFPASMGEETNERSGKAINERQRAGLTATYHFTNNQATALRFLGEVLKDLIPKIYDTERVVKMLAEDGTMSTIQIDPNSPTAHKPVPALDPESIDPSQVAAIFNPDVGEYAVVCTVGPQYDTRRQETLNALTMILSQNESLAPIVGDLMFRCMDFSLADSIADRLKNMVPKQALGQAPDPQVTQLQQMLAQQHQVMNTLSQELTELKSKDLSRELQKEIDWYRAESDRLKVVGGIDPAALMPIVRELVSQVLQQPVNPLINAHMQENSQMISQAQIPPQQPQSPQTQGPQQ